MARAFPSQARPARRNWPRRLRTGGSSASRLMAAAAKRLHSRFWWRMAAMAGLRLLLSRAKSCKPPRKRDYCSPMKPLDKLEQMLGSAFRKIPAGGSQAWEPIEIRRAIIREITEHVQPKGGGEYIFPFAEVAVEIFARDATEQQTFEALVDAAELTEELRSRLGARGCKVDNVTVLIAFVQAE